MRYIFPLLLILPLQAAACNQGTDLLNIRVDVYNRSAQTLKLDLERPQPGTDNGSITIRPGNHGSTQGCGRRGILSNTGYDSYISLHNLADKDIGIWHVHLPTSGMPWIQYAAGTYHCVTQWKHSSTHWSTPSSWVTMTPGRHIFSDNQAWIQVSCSSSI